jgi:hypothetical protein
MGLPYPFVPSEVEALKPLAHFRGRGVGERGCAALSSTLE